jgi:hypothetical protein
MDKPRDEPTVLVRASPEGFKWKVILGRDTVGTGTAGTELEARNAANAFAKRVASEPTEGP